MTDSFLQALILNPFLQTALFAGLAASIAAGIVGSYVVSKRIVFISGSISHAVLGGIGFFVFLKYITGSIGFSPLLGSLLSAIVFAYLIGAIHIRYKQREDTVIAAIWTIGMSLGVIFISVVPGSGAELMNFLFGNLLWASQRDIWLLLLLDIFIIVTCALCHKRFLAICFDETQSYLQRQPVKFLYFLLLTLVAITVVLMIQVIGAILVISLLCLPAAIANILTSCLSKIIYLSVLLSCLFTFLGIFLAYTLNWPPGATIALIITISYFLSLPLKAKSV